MAAGDFQGADAGEDRVHLVERAGFVDGAEVMAADEGEASDGVGGEEVAQGLGVFAGECEGADEHVRARPVGGEQRGEGVAQDEVATQDGVGDFARGGDVSEKAGGVRGCDEAFDVAAGGELVGAALVFEETGFGEREGGLGAVAAGGEHGGDGGFEARARGDGCCGGGERGRHTGCVVSKGHWKNQSAACAWG